MGNDSVKISYNYNDSSVYAKTYVCCHGVDSSFSQVSVDDVDTSAVDTSIDVRYDFNDGVDDDIYLTESGKDYIHVMRADTVFWCYDWRVGRLVQRVYFEDGYDGAAIIYHEKEEHVTDDLGGTLTYKDKRFVAVTGTKKENGVIDFNDNLDKLALLPVTLAYKQIDENTCDIDKWSGYNMNSPEGVFNPFSVARVRAEDEYDGKSVLDGYNIKNDINYNDTLYKYSIFSVLAGDSSYNDLAVLPKELCVVCSKSNIDNSSGALKMSKLRVFLDIEGVSDMSILENVKFALPYKSSEGTTKYIVEKSLSEAKEWKNEIIYICNNTTDFLEVSNENVECEVKFETDSNLNVTVTATLKNPAEVNGLVGLIHVYDNGDNYHEYNMHSAPNQVRKYTLTSISTGDTIRISVKFTWDDDDIVRTKPKSYKVIKPRGCYYLDFDNIDNSYYTLRLEKQNQESSKSYISIPQESVNFYGKNECKSSTDITNNSYWFAGSNKNDCTYSTFTVRTDIHYVIYADDQDTRNINKNTRIKVIGCSIGFEDDLKFKITEEFKIAQYVNHNNQKSLKNSTDETIKEPSTSGDGQQVIPDPVIPYPGIPGDKLHDALNIVTTLVREVKQPFLNAYKNSLGMSTVSQDSASDSSVSDTSLGNVSFGPVYTPDDVKLNEGGYYFFNTFWKVLKIDILPYTETFSIDNKLLVSGFGHFPLLHSSTNNEHEFYGKYKLKFNGYSENHVNVENTTLDSSIQDYFAENMYTDNNYDVIDFLYNDDSVITLSYPFYDMNKYIHTGELEVYNDGTSKDNTKNYAAVEKCDTEEQYCNKTNYNTGRIYIELSELKTEEYISNQNIIKTVYKDADVYYRFKTNAEYPKILNMKLTAKMHNSNSGSDDITYTDYNTSEILHFMFGTNNDEAAFTFNDNVNNTNDTINSDFGYNKDSFEQHEIFNVESFVSFNDMNDGEFNFVRLESTNNYAAFIFDKKLCRIVAYSGYTGLNFVEYAKSLGGECLTDRYLLLASKIIRDDNDDILYPVIKPKFKLDRPIIIKPEFDLNKNNIEKL